MGSTPVKGSENSFSEYFNLRTLLHYYTLSKSPIHLSFIHINHKNYNFLACDWFKNVLFSTNSLAKLLLDSLLSDSLISQSHSKM